MVKEKCKDWQLEAIRHLTQNPDKLLELTTCAWCGKSVAEIEEGNLPEHFSGHYADDALRGSDGRKI